MRANRKKIVLWKRDRVDVLPLISNAPYSVGQIADYAFTSRKKASQRAYKYFCEKLVHRISSPSANPQGRSEYLYWISKKGLSVISSIKEGRVQYKLNNVRQWSAARLDHQLHVNNFHISTHLYCQKKNKIDYTFHHSSRQFKGFKKASLIPDGVLVLRHIRLSKRLLHCIEIDLGSESEYGYNPSSIKCKLEKYLHYYDSGKSRSDFPGTKGFRVLLVTTDNIRAKNISDLAYEIGAGFVFTSTLDELKNREIFNEVWYQPGKDKKVRLINRTD